MRPHRSVFRLRPSPSSSCGREHSQQQLPAAFLFVSFHLISRGLLRRHRRGAKRTSLRFVVTCSGVGVQRHVTLVSIDYPKAMRLPGTQIMDVSVPVRPPPVPLTCCCISRATVSTIHDKLARMWGKGHMHRYELGKDNDSGTAATRKSPW